MDTPNSKAAARSGAGLMSSRSHQTFCPEPPHLVAKTTQLLPWMVPPLPSGYGESEAKLRSPRIGRVQAPTILLAGDVVGGIGITTVLGPRVGRYVWSNVNRVIFGPTVIATVTPLPSLDRNLLDIRNRDDPIQTRTAFRRLVLVGVGRVVAW